MTTIRKELSTFREMIEEVTDDSNITDSFLYDIWNKSRATVLRNELKANNLLSPWNRMRFCVDLELNKSHNCDCVKVGCDALYTKFEIPKPITGIYVGAIEVFTIYGERIGYADEPAVQSDQDDPVKNGKLRWSLYNKKIVVWNSKKLPTIQINGVWEDILDWEDIQTCPDEDCPDILDKDLGINEHNAEAILRRAFDTIKPKLGIVDDWTQERNPERRV